MIIFKLQKDALVLGDKDETYGWTFWAKTDKGDVMFNSQSDNFIEGTQLSAETATPKTSSKGNPYQRLSKVKVVELDPLVLNTDTGEIRPLIPPQPKTAETLEAQLDRIEEKLEEILAILLPNPGVNDDQE